MGEKVALEKSKGSFHPGTASGSVRLQHPTDKDDGLAPILTAPTVCQVRRRHSTGCSTNSSLRPKSRDHAHFTDEETDFVRMRQVQAYQYPI